MKNLLELEPIQKFIHAVGKGVEKYFGKENACIVYLQPDGTFYGVALYEWLSKKKKNLTLATMADDGKGLDEKKVEGRKVLIVDNDIITGKGYKRAMEVMRVRKERLHIKDVKFATYIDRVGLADFSVWKYSSEAIWHPQEIDALDLKIISYLGENGRISFAEIGKKINLSQVAVKNRIDNLLGEGILTIHGVLNIDRFYTMSAAIQLEADSKTVEKLLEKFQKKQEVYHLAKRSGRYSLGIGILAHNIENIESFVENEVRAMPGVKNIEVFIGELPILPKTISPKLS
ncbi:MAG: hypothetical protein Greene071421_489 [Parcubacteria group bacterium Greene0714_21]|nr:MAG: hypothetical protein Greene041639_372 [Parcubacteria group bacterium Greene0416_39]TSC97328.1 MAG: hypothetical protein Greene101447_537 [Parcubacteria group bacterium Greene1014_47]TSD03944.1 MAG: hypothetical protein Greene071421_489 [Parcubacteria group bacterium Greene0714_21]